MNSFKQYTQQDFWDMLPIGESQRKAIIKDFIETNEYDKMLSLEEVEKDNENRRHYEEEVLTLVRNIIAH